MVRIKRRSVRSRKDSLMADQRGAVAFEMPVVTIFLMFSLLLPLADVAIAGFQFISAWEALRGFGQSIQYSPPSDVSNASSWVSSAIAKADTRYPITTINLLCGANSSACSATNTALPISYSYSTTVTLAPLVLKSVLCTSGAGNSCTFTLSYSERFQ
ncbi:hypothetical protein ACFQZO_31080 [Bradyrhizobium sp. GCM10027634]|uniref:hypothetical protein n=1 Tax=unclassified Bradyrhizobium TaxID=2631580 RepID=UPI00263B6B88|nr:hypothetical protein [Bradyrhizobium sp. WYCCWR 12677]MDN5005306.1 hypothetical protein [Bradyrhizobium sp. WYCCWR 12677]